MDKYPNWLWTRAQRTALQDLYNSIFALDGNYTIEERCKFWLIYNGKSKVFGYYKPFTELGIKWTEEDIKVSFLILMEYTWLDENNFIKI